MSELTTIAGYSSFMLCFKKNYQELYLITWEAIASPLSGEDVSILKDGMDENI